MKARVEKTQRDMIWENEWQLNFSKYGLAPMLFLELIAQEGTAVPTRIIDNVDDRFIARFPNDYGNKKMLEQFAEFINENEAYD